MLSTASLRPRALSIALAVALIVGVALLTATGSVAVAASGSAPTASAAATCSVAKDGRKLGASYVTKLTAVGVSCDGAKKVVRAFHACRRANGGAKGTCKKSVRGYRCTEKRQSIATQFTAKAVCRKGSRSIRFSYSQFT